MSDGSTRTQRIKERVRRDVDRLRASTLIIDLALVVVAIAALLTKHERAAEAAIAALVAIYLNHRKPENPVAPLLILATFLGACDSPTLSRSRWHLRFDLLEGVALRPLASTPGPLAVSRAEGVELVAQASNPLRAGGIYLPNTAGAYPRLCKADGVTCFDPAAAPTVDLASPGPIGGTTPAAGTFTTLAAGTPAELSEIDHLRVENALLREQQVCRPVQEQKEAVLKDLEARYKFSVAAGDTLDRDLRKIVRKSATSPR